MRSKIATEWNFTSGFLRYYESNYAFAAQMAYCYASGESVGRPGSRNMLLVDELFMFFMRLKLGLF